MLEATQKTLTSLDTTKLHVQVWLPEGTPRAQIALVHGWSDHSGRYQNLVNKVVPEGIAVHAIDLRGHGMSGGQRGHVHQWADYRNDVWALLDSMDLSVPTFLMGHSMGGLIVLDYMIHHPDTALRGLITSSPLLSPPNVSPVLVKLGQILSRIAPTFSLNPGASADTISRDKAVVEAYVNDPLVHSRATPRMSTEMEATRLFVHANLDAIKMPYLLVYGSADGLVPPDMSREAFEHVASSDKTRHEYEGAYHEVMNDINKDDVLRDIVEWLNAHI